ncbi:hypothetical protein AGLY_002109 [Aphis glycines]|uniref:DUF659 domain-containing protein n=1 Tax=Aphis glycines TaxID=307491 RepID=A0A6G0U447_APHGL|nr:hypothetical protein AGLY_002109 [Aphis glycines]
MPKVKISYLDRLRGYVREYGSDVFSTDGQILFCKIYEVKVAADKKFTITQHKSRDKHKQGLQRKITDETTDVEGRYVANVIVGTLEVDTPGKVFLLNSDVLEKANHSTIAKLFDKSLLILWPTGIKHDMVLLFLSDAAPYMVKAGQSLSSLYSKMIHVTCLAHDLNRVSEEIRGQFSEVDQFISNAKKIFLKAPSRVDTFKTMAPGIPLPPQPIVTRWGTWLTAALYYCEHFPIIQAIINQFDKEDAILICKMSKITK